VICEAVALTAEKKKYPQISQITQIILWPVRSRNRRAGKELRFLSSLQELISLALGPTQMI
jgi:hypothetical protein